MSCNVATQEITDPESGSIPTTLQIKYPCARKSPSSLIRMIGMKSYRTGKTGPVSSLTGETSSLLSLFTPSLPHQIW